MRNDNGSSTNRRIRSEVAFIALPGSAGWMGFRRVVEVNGKAAKDSGATLGELMRQGRSNDYQQARALLAESAAHNLGEPRTINLPNLPLELLHPRHRSRFAHEVYGRDKIHGMNTVLLRLTEQDSPTIIQQAGGGDMKTVVWAWIEPATGRLLRAQVTARDGRIGLWSFIAEIRVEFKDDKKMGVLVPDTMTERFYVDRGSGSGTAKYSNYRRFETSGANRAAMRVAALALAALAASQQPALDTVIERMDAYLATYEPQLSELIADETMQQEVRGRGDFFRTDNIIETRLRRRLVSEVAFIALPEDAGWLGFRHVKTVNNKPVALANASLGTSLTRSRLDGARDLLSASAAHNLGLPRTTNLPNLPLEFLHQRNRKRLLARLDGRERLRGVDSVRLVLLERMTPTLIRNPNTDADMPAVIRAWVDPGNGRLLRAEVNDVQFA